MSGGDNNSFVDDKFPVKSSVYMIIHQEHDMVLEK